MTPAETASTLRLFNAWRRGDEDLSQPNPYEIGRAIDVAVELLDEIERLRAQNETLMKAINTAPESCRTCGNFERREIHSGETVDHWGASVVHVIFEDTP